MSRGLSLFRPINLGICTCGEKAEFRNILVLLSPWPYLLPEIAGKFDTWAVYTFNIVIASRHVGFQVFSKIAGKDRHSLTTPMANVLSARTHVLRHFLSSPEIPFELLDTKLAK
jgi:hypothetical protein